VQVAQEYLGNVDERITRMATILPGGLSLRGGTCGILLGSLGAVGLKYGSVIRSERGRSNELGLKVHDYFRDLIQERSGSTNCRDICGCDFTNPDEAKAYLGSKEQELCAGILTETVRFVLPLLDDSSTAK